ncbi:MAG TPA: orotate phosphoribosyltransferase [Actinospica sp.]|jgi:orotate phosphoribosyltransferase|nr:orotate phosphoribosyltransferase [Actinospica sp.]
MTVNYPQPSAERSALLEQIKERALFRGEFTLSSGLTADYYVDLRRINLAGATAPLVGRVMLDTVRDLEFDAVGGLTMGADPMATAIMYAALAEGRAMDAFVVRKAGKEHGLQRRIEGPDIAGRRVLIVEDASTTGNSPLAAAEAAREAGAEVVAVACIIERGAERAITEAALPYYAAYSLTDLGV